MKKCTNCNLYKEYSEFYKDKRRKDSLRSMCKKCCLIKYPYKVTERGRETWRKYKSSEKGVITCLLNNAFDRAKRKNIPYNLDYKWLEEKIKSGVCELSKMKFNIESRGLYKCNPFAPSIDKINVNKGYTKDNCRVICFCVNMSLCDWGEDILYTMCDNLLKAKQESEK